MRKTLSLLVALLSLACGSTPATPDAPTLDTGTPGTDAPVAVTDSGVPTDTPPAPTDTPVAIDAPTDAPPAIPDRAILVLGDLDPSAFAASNFRAFLGTQGTVTEMADATLNSALLAAYDLVVFGDLVDGLGGAERGAVITWLTTGGSAIVLAGYNATDRAETQSVSSVFQVDVDQDRPDFPTAVTVFVPGAVTQGTLAAPPPIAGAYVIADFSDASGLEIETVPGNDITVRWASAAAGGGRALLHFDDHATLDANWTPEVEQFWTNTFTYLFP